MNFEEFTEETDAPDDQTDEDGSFNVPLVVLHLIVCSLGILGNFLVIFVILVRAEFKKAVSHWYVLQLATADSIFLLTIPFRVVEDIENGWKFSAWMCKAKETILFLNYYSSIFFLVVMSIDRYIAVCHGFSTRLQKLRTPLAAGIITVAVWVICLLICIPIMIYSTPRGIKPICRCEYQFPESANINETCLKEGEKEGTVEFNACVKQLTELPEEACTDPVTIAIGSGGYSGFDGNENWLWESRETTASPGEDDNTSIRDVTLHHENHDVALQPGCHYMNITDGFKAFVLFNIVAMFLIPLIIMSLCYAMIINRLYKSRFHVESEGRQDSFGASKTRPSSLSSTGRKRSKSTSSTKNKNRVRVTIMCATMVAIFFVCWLPFHSVHLARFVGIQQSEAYCHTLFSVVSLIAFANSAINPYVYSFIGTRFWKRLSLACSAVRKSVKNQSSSLSGTIQHHYTKRRPENGNSYSQTQTVMTKIYKGRTDPISGELSCNVFSDKTSEEEQRLTAKVTSPDENGVTSPISVDSCPSYDAAQEVTPVVMTSSV